MTNYEAWWNIEGKELLSSRDENKDVIAQKTQAISDMKALRAHYNPLSFLKNAWVKATNLPGMRNELADLRRQQDSIDAQLRSTALDTVDAMYETFLSSSGSDAAAQGRKISSDKGQLEDAMKPFADIKDRTAEVLGLVNTALKECKEAHDGEVWDMIGNNAFNTMISHQETSEAIEALKETAEGLSSYKEFMDSKRQEIDNAKFNLDTSSLENMAEWDLWMGLADIDLVSFMTSWSNMNKLEDAMEQLEDVKEKLETVHSDANNQASIFSKAITPLAQQELSMKRDLLAQEAAGNSALGLCLSVYDDYIMTTSASAPKAKPIFASRRTF